MLDPGGKARETAVCADDSVAGYHYKKRVFANRPADSAG